MTKCQYSFRDWTFDHFEKGSGTKKYKALIVSNKTGRVKRISFGDNRYEQYKDSTGLGLWSHLDHRDKERRRAYRERHQGDNLNCFSPGFFSWYFLW